MEHPTVKCIEQAYALRSEGRFEECLRVLNERRRSETDPELLDCLILAEANCYLNMPDLDLAERSLDSIDVQSATRRYVSARIHSGPSCVTSEAISEMQGRYSKDYW
jgi:hypothetical protein